MNMDKDVSLELSKLRRLWKASKDNRGGQREYFRGVIMTMRMAYWRHRAHIAEVELHKLKNSSR